MIEFQEEEKIKEEILQYTKKTKIISYVRIGLSINLMIWVICFLSLKEYLLYGLISLGSLFLLLGLVYITNPLYKKLELYKKKEKIYLLHHKRREKEWNIFIDEGKDYLDKNDYKLMDLDIFGHKSLFQYLNVCKTKLGRDSLARQLSNPIKKNKEYTECIYEFSLKEQTLEIEAGLLEFNDTARNMNYDEFHSIHQNKISFKWFFIFPILSFMLMLGYIILTCLNLVNSYPIILFVVWNYILTKLCLRNDIFKLDSLKYYSICDAYFHLSNLMIGLEYSSRYFNEQKEIIINNLEKLTKIKKAYLCLSTRKNFIASLLLNSLFCYDFFLILYFNHIQKSLDTLDSLFEAIAEIEVITSFSVLGIDNIEVSIPKEGEFLYVEDAYHPLVKNCVPNDFSLQGGVILTGSNMSGKTTFMRIIGINQLLFNAGSIVCAKKFSSTNLPIFTSLRANDMLSEGISTFYAEILRMKEMNAAILKGKCLILVDEIFKGTNAHERILASMKVIDKFHEAGALFIISTHDFELCEAKNILNYHFNEMYVDNEIHFDYKIKEGMCTSTNAMYLLKMSGIIEE